MSKSIWKSKTFWFNVASAAVMIASGQAGISIPPKVAVPVITVGNVLLRLLTNQPATF